MDAISKIKKSFDKEKKTSSFKDKGYYSLIGSIDNMCETVLVINKYINVYDDHVLNDIGNIYRDTITWSPHLAKDIKTIQSCFYHYVYYYQAMDVFNNDEKIIIDSLRENVDHYNEFVWNKNTTLYEFVRKLR